MPAKLTPTSTSPRAIICGALKPPAALTYWMSVKPSARRNVSATSNGAKQMAVVNARRIVVVSGGPSSASDAPGAKDAGGCGQ